MLLTNIYVDADASPVKDEAVRVARRYWLKVYLVSNVAMRIPQYRLAEMVVVDNEFDAADDWIVEHITGNDVVASADIPLIARCVRKGARVLDPRGAILLSRLIRETSHYLCEQADDKGHENNKENDPDNACRHRSDAQKPVEPCDDRNDKEYQCIVKHLILPL
jgi:uncharacterized protein YaiI (UPF0178 family)